MGLILWYEKTAGPGFDGLGEASPRGGKAFN